MRKFQAILFDMDGVLRDTEPCHTEAYRRIAAELTGSRDSERDIAGYSNLALYEDLIRRFALSETPQALSHRHFELVRELLVEMDVGPMSGLPELLAALKAQGVRYGVVSSSKRWFIEANLRDIGMLEDTVCVVAGDDGLPIKPAPDMYLAGIAALGLPEDAVIAVEDSFSGVTAAKAAGLRCAAYHNVSSGDQNLSAADWHIYDLRELILP